MTTVRVAASLLLISTFPMFSQQTDVRQFNYYAGYAFLYSPHVGLWENGFQTQFGYQPKTWLAVGFDYSISTGTLTLTPGLLPLALQQQLAAQLAALAAAGQLPPGYMLAVPATSLSQTFAAGPQLAYRHFKKVTLFARPSVGAIRERATPHPKDPIAQAVANQLAPGGNKINWTGFYGFGYGFDIIVTPRFGWRTQGDLVWDHLFNDILRDGRWTTRFSTGPFFNFGKNIAGTK
ncbi:MAG TPA: hypothetical protein VKB88_11640 [Bryobacteraceae bacterium]|nr:hypothetical protein [Bryobacteraceae bacterium]